MTKQVMCGVMVIKKQGRTLSWNHNLKVVIGNSESVVEVVSSITSDDTIQIVSPVNIHNDKYHQEQ
jgi:hypothetical protein